MNNMHPTSSSCTFESAPQQTNYDNNNDSNHGKTIDIYNNNDSNSIVRDILALTEFSAEFSSRISSGDNGSSKESNRNGRSQQPTPNEAGLISKKLSLTSNHIENQQQTQQQQHIIKERELREQEKHQRSNHNQLQSPKVNDSETDLVFTEHMEMKQHDHHGDRPATCAAVRVNPGRNRALSNDSSDYSTYFNDDSNYEMNALEATLVENEIPAQETQRDRSSTTLVTEAIPINPKLQRRRQKQGKGDHNKNNDSCHPFLSRHRRLCQMIGLVLLDLVVVSVMTTTIVLRIKKVNTTGSHGTNDSTTNNTSEGNDGNIVQPYRGNWAAADFPQISQYLITVDAIMDNCSNFGAYSGPDFYYRIQCGPDQAIATTFGGMDDNKPPTAAIQYEGSSQKGHCVRTQVNVLTCNATFTGNINHFGTIISCGTTNEITTTDTDSFPSTVVSVQSSPIIGTSCNTDNRTYNDSVYENDAITYMSIAQAKTEKNVLWISTNRLCNAGYTDSILFPSSCNNSNMITVYDPAGYWGNWSFCASTKAIREEDSNHANVTIIPSMKVTDVHFESLFKGVCPYMEQYALPNVKDALGMKIQIESRLTDFS